MVQGFQFTTRAETETAATGDDQRLLALQQRGVLGDTVVQCVVEGQAQAHDLIDPGLEAAGYAEVVHRRGNQQQVVVEQLANQLIAQGQIGLHRQWACFRLWIKRGGDKGFVDRRNQRPTDLPASHLRLRMTHLPGTEKTFRQTPRVGTVAAWAGMNRKNSTHL
ncbi:hypothetical protein D3C81_1459830 [compost metagenome]